MELCTDSFILLNGLPEVERSEMMLPHVEMYHPEVVVVHDWHSLSGLSRRFRWCRHCVKHLHSFPVVSSQIFKVGLQVDSGDRLEIQGGRVLTILTEALYAR